MSRPADLEISGVTVRFGGLIAVQDASLRAPAGRITGLIGPNGAGKTTTFNACTGLVKPTAGTVTLDGRRLDGHTPARRAQLGLGRTFQRIALWDTMSVAENVALGLECRLAGRGPFGQLRSPGRERSRVTEAAREAMERCGIADLADIPAGDLSTGQRRLVELARAMTGDFRCLLLDEPSSGLDEQETERFGDLLHGIVAANGIGVLIVEHDMTLVREVCSYIYCLDFGQLIYEGETAEALASNVVQAAYLGAEEADDGVLSAAGR